MPTTTYTTPGTVTVTIPSGATNLKIECWGGGGGGGATDTNGSGGGGGGGAYSVYTAASPAAGNWTILVAGGGYAGVDFNSYAGDGQGSKAINPSGTTVCFANGGGGGAGNAIDYAVGGLGGTVSVGTGYSGGDGGQGDPSEDGNVLGGGGGGSAGPTFAGSPGSDGISGDGSGGAGYAYGGNGDQRSIAAQPGNAPGGGGGGDAVGNGAGTGANGQVKVTYTVVTAPVADFTGTPLSGTDPLSVTFTDASTNTPTSWLWERNSGSGWASFSTAQNPTQSFAAGTWSVRLTATNAGGSDTKTRTNYVVVTSYSWWWGSSNKGLAYDGGGV